MSLIVTHVGRSMKMGELVVGTERRASWARQQFFFLFFFNDIHVTYQLERNTPVGFSNYPSIIRNLHHKRLYYRRFSTSNHGLNS